MIITKQDNLGITKVNKNNIGVSGVGFIVIPDANNREEYIEECYRTNKVTIQGGRGYGYFNNVNVDSEIMQKLTFPKGTDDDNRGSAVVWIRDDVSGLPVIIGILRKQEDYYSLAENQIRMAKSTEDSSVEIFMDGNGTINILSNGGQNQSAEVSIKLSSVNANSVFNIVSDNAVSIQSGNSVKVITDGTLLAEIRKEGERKAFMQYTQSEGLTTELEKQFSLKVVDDSGEEKALIKYDEDGFTYSDEFNNEIVAKNGEVNIKSTKISHNNGNEPMVLGDTLADLLGNLCDGIAAITVTCAAPGSASTVPINAAVFTAIKAQLQRIKSNKSKLE